MQSAHPRALLEMGIKQKAQRNRPPLKWSVVGQPWIREPRILKGARVAAPCVCFVPWAALASCRPLPQQLLPVSAAGRARRRCTGLFLRCLQRRRRSCSNPPACPIRDGHKTKSSTQSSPIEMVSCGATVDSRAALLKTAHWAVFAPSSATSPQLFESTLASPFLRLVKQKLRHPLDTGVLGGRGWIRTTEAESSRFTVCPHWPLGNTPIFTFCCPADCLYILPPVQ